MSQLPGPRQYPGNAPPSQNGTNGQSEASGGTEGEEEGESDDSPEVVSDSEFSTTCHEKSDDVGSTPHWIRTSNLRFRRSRLDRQNPLFSSSNDVQIV